MERGPGSRPPDRSGARLSGDPFMPPEDGRGVDPTPAVIGGPGGVHHARRTMVLAGLGRHPSTVHVGGAQLRQIIRLVMCLPIAACVTDAAYPPPGWKDDGVNHMDEDHDFRTEPYPRATGDSIGVSRVFTRGILSNIEVTIHNSVPEERSAWRHASVPDNWAGYEGAGHCGLQRSHGGFGGYQVLVGDKGLVSRGHHPLFDSLVAPHGRPTILRGACGESIRWTLSITDFILQDSSWHRVIFPVGGIRGNSSRFSSCHSPVMGAGPVVFLLGASESAR